jgi:hypothetical protein
VRPELITAAAAKKAKKTPSKKATPAKTAQLRVGDTVQVTVEIIKVRPSLLLV